MTVGTIRCKRWLVPLSGDSARGPWLAVRVCVCVSSLARLALPRSPRLAPPRGLSAAAVKYSRTIDKDLSTSVQPGCGCTPSRTHTGAHSRDRIHPAVSILHLLQEYTASPARVYRICCSSTLYLPPEYTASPARVHCISCSSILHLLLEYTMRIFCYGEYCFCLECNPAYFLYSQPHTTSIFISC